MVVEQMVTIFFATAAGVAVLLYTVKPGEGSETLYEHEDFGQPADGIDGIPVTGLAVGLARQEP